MLSQKAQAFSMDRLLGKTDPQTDTAPADVKLKERCEEFCSSLGDEGCHHRSSVDVVDDDSNKISVELCQADLWQAFHSLGTEMIITKTGRRMFPAVRVRVSGLKKSSKYKMHMDFVPVDKNKYRYVYHSSKWMVSGIGENMKAEQTYNHPDSPMRGDYISSQVISFEKIKLTNNDSPSHGQVSLMSMQKFQPRIIIEEVKHDKSYPGSYSTVTFPQTTFIAVTAYQNQEITRLKIARNPFAKGFREAGKCRSSLEAMMASFGVVVDSNSTHCSRKRQLHSTDDCEGLSPPSPRKPNLGVWMPSYRPASQMTSSCSSRLHLLESQSPCFPIPSYYPPGLHSNISVCTDYEPVTPTNALIDCVKQRESDHTPTQASQLQNVRTPEVDKLDIHPAFRWQHTPVPTPQSQLMDPNILAAYYRGCIYSPLSSMVCVQPPSGLWTTPTSAYGAEHLQSSKLSPTECVDMTVKKDICDTSNVRLSFDISACNQ